MSRYFTRAGLVVADHDYTDRIKPDTIEVEATGSSEPRFTGLLDRGGQEIWCAPEPVGFDIRRRRG